MQIENQLQPSTNIHLYWTWNKGNGDFHLIQNSTHHWIKKNKKTQPKKHSNATSGLTTQKVT